MTTVIVVKFNNPKVEQVCLNSVIQHTSAPHHLVAFDNYPKNQNLGQLWNKLIDQAESEYICLLNSDTEVTPGWLDKLLETFDVVDDVGCVGPSTTNARNHQNESRDEIFIDYGKAHPHWVLGGFCLVFSKKVWHEIGGFPNDFGFYGQEVALIDKMTVHDYKQIWRTDVMVKHEGAATVKKMEKEGKLNEDELRKEGRDNYERFREEIGVN